VRVDYIPRVVDSELRDMVATVPAISIEGAKGVGKTESARRLAASVHELDRPDKRELAAIAPDRLLSDDPPVLIDEWQRHPSIWDACRREVDRSPDVGRFILTGSAAPDDVVTHSGAGRIVTIRMRPLTLFERGIDTPTVSVAELLTGSRPEVHGRTTVGIEEYVREIVRGGFPGMRLASDRAVRALIDGYIDRISEKDFRELGFTVRRPGTLRRWMAAYAAASSQTTSFDTIRDAASSGSGPPPARTTTIPYRDTLERLGILDPVPAWLPSKNHLKRLTQAPKHHLVDPALAARLLGIGEGALLGGAGSALNRHKESALLGALFESLVTQSIRVYGQAADARIHHLRTYGGEREIDLLLVRDDQRVVAIEVKVAPFPSDSDVRHLSWLREILGENLLDVIVVVAGREAYRRHDGVAVVPAALLGP
jgi:predicted AAA+ superfamily ATPase